MQTTQHTHGTEGGFTAKLISNIRAFFGGLEHDGGTLAGSCAADIQRVNGLARWVESLASLDPQERRGMLLRAAATFRGELSATDLANALSCMATDAGLFLAVNDALKRATPGAVRLPQAA